MHTRRDVLDAIAADAQLSALLTYVRDTLDASDDAHGLEHLLRVAMWTVRLGEGGLDEREALAAALLHDIVNVPKDDPRRAQASQLCADHARALLPDYGFGPEATARITDAIRDHSFSRGATPTGPLGRALQDADRLEALGAIGIMRVFATGVRMNANFSHPTDPWAQDRPLDDVAFSVDHFFTKLLRLPDTLLTPAGRAEAQHRADLMRVFLHQYGDELGAPPPASRLPPRDD